MVIIIIRERARDNQQGIILGGFSKYAITLTDRFLDQVGADPSKHVRMTEWNIESQADWTNEDEKKTN